MGDPRKTRRKYVTPVHPWNKERIDEEKILKREYGLVNKKEIFKMRSILKNFKDQAKKLIALQSAQAEKERQQMFSKLVKLGLLQGTTSSDSVLDLDIRDVLERRLQTQVYKKGFAKTPKQARQFITHGHIIVKGKKITAPSYILSVEEETNLNFHTGSKLNDIDHPERFVKEAETKADKTAEKKKERPAGKRRPEKKKDMPVKDKKPVKAEDDKSEK